jgi:nucleoporin SEH1
LKLLFLISLLTSISSHCHICRTVLSSAGNDGRVRLWKAALGGSIWRPAGSIGVEQAEESDAQGEDKDVDMQS